MSELKVTWDPRKAQANLRKHGVSFGEAQSVFYDEHATLFFDDTHSDSEDRFLLLGLSSGFRILLICHCYRESDEIIRIISARRATKSESELYRGL